jgi:hypothetical protein
VTFQSGVNSLGCDVEFLGDFGSGISILVSSR